MVLRLVTLAKQEISSTAIARPYPILLPTSEPYSDMAAS